MNSARSMFLVLAGVAAGIGFVLSCGDNLSAKATADAAMDAPKAADAPACDCPAAEPPLVDRLVVVDVLITLDGNQAGFSNIVCPPGARPISGSCTVDGLLSDRDVLLKESGFSDNPLAWRCSYRNNEPTQITFRVSALCLKAPP